MLGQLRPRHQKKLPGGYQPTYQTRPRMHEMHDHTRLLNVQDKSQKNSNHQIVNASEATRLLNCQNQKTVLMLNGTCVCVLKIVSRPTICACPHSAVHPAQRQSGRRVSSSAGAAAAVGGATARVWQHERQRGGAGATIPRARGKRGASRSALRWRVLSGWVSR